MKNKNKIFSKKLYLFFCVFILSIKIFGQSQSNIIPSNNNLDKRQMLISIHFQSIAERDKIIGLGIDITNADKNILQAIVKKSELKKLQSLGYNVEIIAQDYRSLSPFYETKTVPKPYHNYADIKQFCIDAAYQNPTFIKYYVIGKSVENRDIIALKITDNPDIEEAEPEVRLVSLHHGDELSSSEFALYLIKFFVEKYNSSDTDTLQLINTTEIWIIPALNPDGMESSGGPMRYNANYVDLNRNYTCPDPNEEMDFTGGDYPFSEPETSALKNISLPTGNAINNSFVLSLTYHGGAEYFNYVWNYSPSLTPDDQILRFQGNNYKYYVNLAGQTNFKVINGYEWYKTVGDLNDWAYGFTSSLDTTIEMTASKIPKVSTQTDIDKFCLPHLEATLYSIWFSGEGIRGRVVDSATSQPLLAYIKVKEVPKIVTTDPTEWGDFYRILLAGTYTVEISAKGYYTKTINNVVVPPSAALLKKRNYNDLGVIGLEQKPNYWLFR